MPLCHVAQWLSATAWKAECFPANALFSFSDLMFKVSFPKVLGSPVGSVNSTFKEDFNSLVSDMLEW